MKFRILALQEINNGITISKINRDSIARYVIQATGTVQFGVGFRTLSPSWCPCVATSHSLGSIKNPTGGVGLSWGGVVVIRTLLSDQMPNCLIQRISGI